MVLLVSQNKIKLASQNMVLVAGKLQFFFCRRIQFRSLHKLQLQFYKVKYSFSRFANTVFLVLQIQFSCFLKKAVLLVSQITVFLMSQNIVGIQMEDWYFT